MTVRRKIMLIRLKGAWIWPDVDWRLFCRAPHAKNVTANKRSLDIRQRTEMDVPKPRKEPSVESISAPLAPVDPLGEALNFLRVSGMYYSRSELSEPWGVRLPTFPGCLMFHMVMEGCCWVDVEGAEPLLLEPGHLVLVPHGKGHQIASRAGIPAVKLFDLDREEISERYEMIRHGGGGPTTRAVCCTVRYDHPAAHQLIALLPPLINVQTINAPGKDLIESMIRLLGDEARALSPGSETVITRLADILLIQTIRLWIEQDAATQKGWLGALRDRQLGRALFLIHRHPEQPWTVESLATEVAMSRAGFAARFKEMVGESPMQYVTRGKMHLALTWLKEDDAPLSQLAPRLGYQSEAAFSRAFKRCIGVAPGGIRRRDVWGFID
jgi:AraC-like DNA-binding protein